MDTWDLIVVGGGPAGMAAALVASQNRVRTLLLEGTAILAGQVRRADAPILDVLGFPAPDGAALAAAFARHLESAGVVSRLGVRVRRIAREQGEFRVAADGETFAAAFVLLATGLQSRRLGVPGEDLLDPSAHARKIAPALGGRRVVVVGGGDEACDTARCLADAGAAVTMIVRRGLRARPLFSKPLEGRPGVIMRMGEEVACFEGGGALEAVRLRSGERVEASSAFVRIGAEPLLPEMEPAPQRLADGRVEVDRRGRTSVPGLLAAGDIVREPAERYIAVACADGVIAARTVEELLAR